MSDEITGRSLTFVEADVDVYRITRFEAARAGAPLDGWSLIEGVNTSLTGVIDAALPSGRGARLQKTVANGDAVWRWAAMPSALDVSVVALLRSQIAAEDAAIVLRNAAPGWGYLLRLANNVLEIRKGVGAGSYALLAALAFDVVANDSVWLRFDAAAVTGPGVLLRGKVWRGALTDEPQAFAVVHTDSVAPIAAPGPVGLYTFTAGSDVLCGHFRAKSLLGSAVETLRFAKPADYLPREISAVPDLVEASLSPGSIALGESLGERATLSVVLKDHPGADLGELFGAGTHWGKARARELFRRGQPIRVKRGLLGQSLDQFETRHYVFDSFSGPSPQGAVALIAKDALKLADDDRALAPRPSNGRLVAAITNVAASATLTPSGIGNAEYPASGHVAIGGKEICAFTRVDDVLTLTRAQFGTAAIAHNAEDRAQLCLQFSAVDPATIIHALLTGYAGIASGTIPLAAWQQETTIFLQRVYTRMIAEPTGVNKLVSELIEQAGLAVWFDDRSNQIKLQVLRGIVVDAYVYSQSNVLQGSLSVADQPEKQITQCWTYYGVRNPLEPLDATENYRSALATANLEAETQAGSPSIRTIFGTWIPALGRATAQRVNDLQIGRFVRPPRRFAFDVLRYSGVEEPQPGGGYRIAWWGNQDEAGAAVNAPIQVTRVNPTADRMRVEAEELLFKIFDAGDLKNRNIVVDGNFNNLNVRTSHDSIYGAPTGLDIVNGVNLSVIVSAGVIVGSTATSTFALDIGAWPNTTAIGNTTNASPVVTSLSVSPLLMEVGTPVTGPGIPANTRILTRDSATQITLDKNATALGVGVTLTFWLKISVSVVGRVQGRGGDGGNANENGNPGGGALRAQHPITLNDVSGQIFGGGGGGASTSGPAAPGGGGGQGQLPGGGGTGSGGAGNGAGGTTEAAGVGGIAGDWSASASGGGAGLPGGNTATRSGGAAGAAIDGISFVTTVGAIGDRRGAQIN